MKNRIRILSSSLETPMIRAAGLAAVLSATLSLSPARAATTAAPAPDSAAAKPAALPVKPAVPAPAVTAPKASSLSVQQPAASAPAQAVRAAATQAVIQAAPDAKAVAETVAPRTPVTATPAQPATQPPMVAPRDTTKPVVPAGTVLPDPRRDSAEAKTYKVASRPFSREEAKQIQAALGFKAKGKPESTAVNWIFRDEKGAMLAYERGASEWSYGYDTVPFLDPKDYVADSLIRSKTDGLLKAILKDKSAGYAFVNYEKTMVQPRDERAKEGVGPSVPAYYIGRYLRKLDDRYVLGDAFQVRIGVGRGNTLNLLSYREPLATPAGRQKVPTREMVEDYLAKWAKQPARLGRRYYPYHPDKLRIRGLKPVKVFESYVLTQEKFREDPSKDGTYLVPRITVLAEASLAKSQKRMQVPPPAEPLLLHFHFPCTPGAGLCWPDGQQGLEDGPRPDIGPRPLPPPPPSQVPPAESPKTGATTPAPAAPAPSQVAPAPATPAPTAPAPKAPAKP